MHICVNDIMLMATNLLLHASTEFGKLNLLETAKVRTNLGLVSTKHTCFCQREQRKTSNKSGRVKATRYSRGQKQLTTFLRPSSIHVHFWRPGSTSMYISSFTTRVVPSAARRNDRILYCSKHATGQMRAVLFLQRHIVLKLRCIWRGTQRYADLLLSTVDLILLVDTQVFHLPEQWRTFADYHLAEIAFVPTTTVMGVWRLVLDARVHISIFRFFLLDANLPIFRTLFQRSQDRFGPSRQSTRLLYLH